MEPQNIPHDDVTFPSSVAEPPDADAPEDLESAYRAALEALESAEVEVGRAFEQLADDEDDPHDDAPVALDVVVAVGSPGEPPDPTETAENDAAPVPPSPERPTPLGILEAALFVGGTDLTTKRLQRMFNDEFDADRIAGFVDELNERYARECRPYEIAFGEGGYRLAIREEFEDVRNRVFGLGPREIKLSQPALEVLSLIAYRQPIDKPTIATHGGKSNLAMLRQLVRRELVEIDRTAAADEPDDEIRYRTTARFLEVFGIGDLDELPRAVELEFK